MTEQTSNEPTFIELDMNEDEFDAMFDEMAEDLMNEDLWGGDYSEDDCDDPEIEALQKQIKELTALNELMREALEIYANEKYWRPGTELIIGPFMVGGSETWEGKMYVKRDRGDYARETLSTKPQDAYKELERKIIGACIEKLTDDYGGIKNNQVKRLTLSSAREALQAMMKAGE